MQKTKYKKLGISLSGGSVFGFAHIGVLRCFEEREIEVNQLIGVSAGAVVGALYAFGISLDEIEAEAQSLSWSRISDMTFSSMGIISNDSLGKLIVRLIGEKNIEDAMIPLSILATDIHTGKEVVFTSGPVAKAVMASAAIPGIFNPVMYGDQMLVDGGLSNNMPYQVLVDMGADVTVGVNVLADSITYVYPKNYIDVLSNSFLFLLSHSRKQNREKFDLLLEPDLSAYTSSDFSKRTEIIEAGRREAARNVSKLLQKITDKKWWQKVI